MKKEIRRALALLLALVLTFALCACGSKPAPQPENTEQPKTEEKKEEEKKDEKQEETKPAEPTDSAIHVSSVEEFISAIQPGAEIAVEPGLYNLTNYLDYMYKEYGDKFGEKFKYLELDECFDGIGLIIHDCKNLKINGIGETSYDVEFVIEPRYANVLTFNYCDNLSLSNITLGHTDTGDCSGDVLSLYVCSDVELLNLDMYGCGVNGLVTEACDKLDASYCSIHDCSENAADIFNSRDIVFNNCIFTDNWWGFWIYDNTNDVIFNNCRFGQSESNSIIYIEEVVLNDCDIMDPTEYPDYSDYDDIVLPGMEESVYAMTELDADLLTGATWYGYMVYNCETGNLYAYEDDMPVVEFFSDGTCNIVNYFNEPYSLWWELSNNYGSLYEFAGDEFSCGNLYMYVDDTYGYDDYVLELDYGEEFLYLYIGAVG